MAGRQFAFETGRLARLADGAVLVRAGHTQVLATAVCVGTVDEGADFLPLQVGRVVEGSGGGLLVSYFMLLLPGSFRTLYSDWAALLVRGYTMYKFYRLQV